MSADTPVAFQQVAGVDGSGAPTSDAETALWLAGALALRPGQEWRRRCALSGVYLQPTLCADDVRKSKAAPLDTVQHPSGFCVTVLRPAYARFQGFQLRKGTPAPLPGIDTEEILSAVGCDPSGTLRSFLPHMPGRPC